MLRIEVGAKVKIYLNIDIPQVSISRDVSPSSSKKQMALSNWKHWSLEADISRTEARAVPKKTNVTTT